MYPSTFQKLETIQLILSSTVCLLLSVLCNASSVAQCLT